MRPLPLATLLCLALAAPAAAHDASVLADGLDNPRGLDLAPNGDLYVAESGRGGTGPCVPAGGPGVQCFGRTGAVARIELDSKHHARVATGLPSLANEDGGQAGGPSDVSFRGRRRGLLTIGLHAEVAVREALGSAGASLASLNTLRENGRIRPLADLGAFEAAANPDGGELASNPNSVDSTRRDWLVVADASADAVLSVSRRGRVVPGGAPTVYASGFTHITDLAFGPRGALYVLELSKRSLLSIPDGGHAPGRLIRVRRDGSRSELAPGRLETPTALVVAKDGTSYVSNRGASAGIGQVLRITPDP